MKRLKDIAIGECGLNKSRFLAVAYPFSDPKEFTDRYAEAKKRFPKADHYPYAYRVGAITKSSDDGEPGGTGGRPLLGVIDSQGFDNVLLIVARYFGGTKLGTPNLRRCFVESGTLALQNGVAGSEKKRYVYRFTLEYGQFDALQRIAKKRNWELRETTFGESVETKLWSDDKLTDDQEGLGMLPSPLPKPEETIEIVWEERK